MEKCVSGLWDIFEPRAPAHESERRDSLVLQLFNPCHSMEACVSKQDSLWGAHGVSRAVTGADASQFFAKNGLYYQENAAIGDSLASLDREGLSNSTESFKILSEYFDSDPVSSSDDCKRISNTL